MKYQIKRKGILVAEIEPTGAQDRQAMGVNIVDMEFSLLNPIEIIQGDTVNVYGEEYFFPIAKANKTKDTSSLLWKYKVQLVHHYYRLANYPYNARNKDNKLLVPNFSYTGDLSAHFALFMQNLNEYEADWATGVIDSTEIRTITYADNNLLNVLNKWTEEFKTEYWIENKTIHLTKRTGDSGIVLGYGKGEGLTSLNQTVKDNRSIFTRLIAQGGSTNLPADYGYTNLQLPASTNGYIEDASKISNYGKIVATKTFEDIIPERIGTVSQIGDEFTFYDASLDFDVAAYYLPGITPKIGFQTGQLAGLQFPITGYDNTTKKFTIGVNEDEKVVQLPNASIKPAVGDKYSIFYTSLPVEYITDAQSRLLIAATEYYNDGSDENYSDEYTVICDKYHFQKNNIVPVLGFTVNLTNPEPLLIDVDKRVSGIKRNLQDEWDYQLTVTDDINITQTARSFLQQDKVYSLFATSSKQELTTNNQSFLGQLSGSNGYLYIAGVKSKAGFADLAAEATHAYDADYADIAGEARKVISADFVSGFTGSGHKLDGAELELDKITVRKELNAYTLNIKEVTGVGGSFAVTNVGKISKITMSGSDYVCEWDTDEGTIYNPFVINDFVRCQIYDSQKAKYYLAKVLSTTSTAFTLQIVEGAGVPAVGDKLFQFGNATNTARQGLLYLTNSDSGAPYMDVVDGVDSASLADKTKVRIGKLSGITDAAFGGALSGYGLYGDNVYLKNGTFIGVLKVIGSGSNVYTKDETDNEIQAVNTKVEAIFSDGQITPDEKRSLKMLYDAAANEVEDKKTLAASLGVSSTSYNAAFVTLQTNVSPFFTDMSSTSTGDGAAIRGYFNDYGVQKSLLDKAIGEAQKNQIDNIKVGGSNLIDDSSFESGRLPAPYAGSACTAEIVTTDKWHGNKSCKVTFTSSLSNNRADLTKEVNPSVAFLKNKDVVFSVWVKGEGATIGKTIRAAFTSTNPFGTVYGEYFTLTSEWQRISIAKTLPSSSNLFYGLVAMSTAPGDVIYVDAMSLTEGNKIVPYDISTNDILAATSKLITLTGATQIITVDKSGNKNPASSFTVTGFAQNTTITTWEYSIDGGTYSTTLPAGVTRSSDVVTIAPTTVTFKLLTIRATDGTYKDSFSVARVVDGADGADGTGIEIKGSVPTYAALPSSGLTAGDAYLVNADGLLYIYDGTAFPVNGNGIEFKGDDGAAGADGYTVLLTNESHTFVGDEDSAITASTDCDVVTYKGVNAISATVTVGTLPTGMTASVSGSTVTFNVTQSMTTGAGSVDITIVADGNTFVRKFSYSIAFKGLTGRAVQSVDTEYAITSSSTVAPTTGWQTDTPVWSAGNYIWSRVKSTFTDATTSTSNPAMVQGSGGAAGADGRGISELEEQYYLSTSSSTQTGGSWSATRPTWAVGKYYWTRTKITYANPSSTEYTTPIVSLAENIANSKNGTYTSLYPTTGYRAGDSMILSVQQSVGASTFLKNRLYYTKTTRGDGATNNFDWLTDPFMFTSYVQMNDGYRKGDYYIPNTDETVTGTVFKAGVRYNTNTDRNEYAFNKADWKADAAGIQNFTDVDAITSYTIGDLLTPTATKSRGGKTFVVDNTYRANATSSSFNSAHWAALSGGDFNRNFTGVTSPTNYKVGDTWQPFSDITAGGKAFSGTKVYTATTASATFNAAHWELKVITLDYNSLALGSMIPPLKEWNIGANMVVNVVDGVEGNEAIDMTSSSYVVAPVLMPVSTTKKYKTVFWARRSATNNGVLYFAMKQWKDYGITTCDNNGGLSPYAHSGVTVPTTWTKYEYIWSSADYQTNVRYMQPIFLGNYGGSLGYIEIQAFKVYEVTEIEQLSYVKGALQTSTEIIGGLTLTSIVGARNSGTSVRAYMSGQEGNPVAFAAGVTGFGTGSEARIFEVQHNGDISVKYGGVEKLGFVASTGVLTITGTVNATSGNIGGFTIGTDSIKSNTPAWATPALVIDKTNNRFDIYSGYVTSNNASNGVLEADVTIGATSGYNGSYSVAEMLFKGQYIDANRDVVSVSGNGVISNSSNSRFIPSSSGIDTNASIVGLLRRGNSQNVGGSFSGRGISAAVAGISQANMGSYNSRTYGGFFNTLFGGAMYVGNYIKSTNATYNIGTETTMVYFVSGAAGSNNFPLVRMVEEGRVLIFKNASGSTQTVTRSGSDTLRFANSTTGASTTITDKNVQFWVMINSQWVQLFHLDF